MGFCSILKDIFKPPLLVFFVTITVLAIILFAFSISLEINKGKILNPDIQSWNSFYRSVSALGVCLQVQSEGKVKTTSDISDHQIQDESNLKQRKITLTKVSILTDATLIIDEIIQNNYFIHAVISAEDLGFPKSKDEVEMTISTPNPKNKQKPACVSLLGPSYLLPDAEVVLPHCSQPEKPPRQELTFMPSAKVKQRDFCLSGHFGSLTIEENLNVYLSEMDTSLIQMHIFVTSSILFVMIFIFFLYSLFGKLCKNDKKHSSDPDLVLLES